MALKFTSSFQGRVQETHLELATLWHKNRHKEVDLTECDLGRKGEDSEMCSAWIDLYYEKGSGASPFLIWSSEEFQFSILEQILVNF